MNEREIALYILMDIFKDGGYNNIALRKALNAHPEMTNVQKAFVTEIVNGTLRNLIRIDYIINQFSKTPVKKMKPFIRTNMRMGIYQLIFMDKIPQSAVCNEAVKLAKKHKFASLSGFVNGILRNVARNIDNISYPNKEKEPVKYLSVTYSCPEWIIEYWLKSYDFETVNKICIANNKAPSISLCVNTLKNTKEELANTLKDEGVEIDMDTLLQNSLYVRKTSNIGELESYKKGLFHIMDESSMLATRILNPDENSVVIDVCSAPGGKTFATAEIMKNTGKVISRDIYEHKAELIKEGADRLGLTNVEVQVRDALEDKEDIGADFVFVDAPCSGLGLVRKKPDIKNNKTMADVEELASLQRKILAVASKKVKKDGILVYSTCTVSEKENIENVRWFVDNFDFEPVDFSELLPEKVKYETAKKGYIEILPSDYGTDGFFISKFRRK